MTRQDDLAPKMVRGAAAVQTALAVTWIAMGIVDLRCVDYGMIFVGSVVALALFAASAVLRRSSARPPSMP